MKSIMSTLTMLMIVLSISLMGQKTPKIFKNPILPGFNPDPSICRAGDDYYLVTSSFTWFPGIPIYHSKDLVNWELIGHGITRPDQINFNKIKDEKGIWAVTIRYHDGVFYLITTCSDCGGNFYITAKDPAGEWTDPVWIKDAEGIDPSLFWDDDGTCYYTGNTWGFKSSWPSQCAIWIQKMDFQQQKLVGKRKILSYGHANNAAYGEGPHIYKIVSRYLLLMSEGGSGYNHAVTSHQSSTLSGPYIADRINPVLTHRHLGSSYPVQTVGHADLVQTQYGDWWAVVLGTRKIDGQVELTRETFLSKVDFQDGTPIFNPGAGKVLLEQECPSLPWCPVKTEPNRDEFDGGSLAIKWYTTRTPLKQFYNLKKGCLTLKLLPETVDSLVHTSMLIQRIKDHKYSTMTKLSFQTNKENEQAGIIMYRNTNSYYMLLKEKDRLALIKKFKGEKIVVAVVPYKNQEVYLGVKVGNLDLQFSYGASLDNITAFAKVQELDVLGEGNGNKFNGPGIGMYATSNGKITKNTASFDWFEYIPENSMNAK